MLQKSSDGHDEEAAREAKEIEMNRRTLKGHAFASQQGREEREAKRPKRDKAILDLAA